MRQILITFLFMLLQLTVGAQTAPKTADTTRYVFPVRQVAGHYAANFGEIRPGHFHAGVDIKTDGTEGKPVVAVADGYVSRVVVTTYGYGKAVYLTLKDGTTAVYGHLQRFRDDIADCVQAERYRTQSNGADLWFKSDRWPVKQGELLGYSGNSGSSMGPHLHFELREAKTGRRLNLIRQGFLRAEDHLPPRILRVHYVEVDTVQGVCQRTRPASYNTVHEADGRYRLARTEPVPVGRKGYFVVEVSDRRDNVHNTFSVWRLSATLDGEPFFEYRMDGFTYDCARCSDAVSWYAEQCRSRNEVIRMARQTGAPEEFYPILREQGLVRVEAGCTHTLRIEAEDDCGNRSTLTFEIRGREGEFHAQADSTALVLRPDRNNPVAFGRMLTAHIPAGALYESCYCRPEMHPAPHADTGVVVLSPALRLLEASVPLRKEATVTIQTAIPRTLRLHAGLAHFDPDKQKWSYVGGTGTGDSVTAKTRKTGWLAVVADTLAPRIRPRFAAGADLTRAETLRFTVTDNFTGITSGSLHIDGRWVPCDRLPMRSLFVHTFDTPPQRTRHHVRFTATDGARNTACWEGSFYR